VVLVVDNDMGLFFFEADLALEDLGDVCLAVALVLGDNLLEAELRV
jgi:hypothetical protein